MCLRPPPFIGLVAELVSSGLLPWRSQFESPYPRNISKVLRHTLVSINEYGIFSTKMDRPHHIGKWVVLREWLSSLVERHLFPKMNNTPQRSTTEESRHFKKPEIFKQNSSYHRCVLQVGCALTMMQNILGPCEGPLRFLLAHYGICVTKEGRRIWMNGKWKWACRAVGFPPEVSLRVEHVRRGAFSALKSNHGTCSRSDCLRITTNILSL